MALNDKYGNTGTNEEMQLVVKILGNIKEKLDNIEKIDNTTELQRMRTELATLDITPRVYLTKDQLDEIGNNVSRYFNGYSIAQDIKKHIEKPKFWGINRNHLWVSLTILLLSLLLGTSLYFNWSQHQNYKKLEANQDELMLLLADKTAFWFSKTDQRAYLDYREDIEKAKLKDQSTKKKK